MYLFLAQYIVKLSREDSKFIFFSQPNLGMRWKFSRKWRSTLGKTLIVLADCPVKLKFISSTRRGGRICKNYCSSFCNALFRWKLAIRRKIANYKKGEKNKKWNSFWVEYLYKKIFVVKLGPILPNKDLVRRRVDPLVEITTRAEEFIIIKVGISWRDPTHSSTAFISFLTFFHLHVMYHNVMLYMHGISDLLPKAVKTVKVCKMHAMK